MSHLLFKKMGKKNVSTLQKKWGGEVWGIRMLLRSTVNTDLTAVDYNSNTQNTLPASCWFIHRSCLYKLKKKGREERITRYETQVAGFKKKWLR